MDISKWPKTWGRARETWKIAGMLGHRMFFCRWTGARKSGWKVKNAPEVFFFSWKKRWHPFLQQGQQSKFLYSIRSQISDHLGRLSHNDSAPVFSQDSAEDLRIPGRCLRILPAKKTPHGILQENNPGKTTHKTRGIFRVEKKFLGSRFASVDNISFTDYDLDFGDLGGLVRWDKPLDESKAQSAQKNITPGWREDESTVFCWEDLKLKHISNMDGA